MNTLLNPTLLLGLALALSLALSVAGCPDDDDDDGDPGGMCFYDCSSADGSMSGCWWHESEDDCLDEVEETCGSNGFDINEVEYEEGCSMCDECNPDWYEI